MRKAEKMSKKRKRTERSRLSPAIRQRREQETFANSIDPMFRLYGDILWACQQKQATCADTISLAIALDGADTVDNFIKRMGI